MDFKFVNSKISLNEDVDANKFLANRVVAKNVQQIKDLFLEHGYDLTKVPGEFVKTLTLNEKEAVELSAVLDEIDKLGLKDIFNYNLRPSSFKRSFLDRVKYCLENHLPFLNGDNTFIADLKNDNMEVERKEDIAPSYSNTELDEEDLEVKSNIIKTLGEINERATDTMLTFIISSIITNLDMAIKKSAKNYRVLGLRSVVEEALMGVALTPEMQELVNNDILNAFPKEEERGL